jgi:hypothetical protein
LRRLFSDNRADWLKGRFPNKPELGFWCPGLGFLDEKGRRVGCLLHPSHNQGRDLRGPTGYADKCRREWCQEARAWAALGPGERGTLLALCADMDSLAFGSQRENPLRRLLAFGPQVAAGAAGLGLKSRPELARLNWLDQAPAAWGWLLGLLVETRGADVLTWSGLAQGLEQAVSRLVRALAPRPPLAQGRLVGELCDQWEARLWRLLSGRARVREDEIRRWRHEARNIVVSGEWR